jgi:hypothetical protein
MLQTTARQDLVNEFVQACAAQVRGVLRDYAGFPVRTYGDQLASS